ncbi:MAG: hypothetical protein PHH22_01735 [Clostridia bacterium]|nr:hypothetical protein [Clostridia bacterium]
MKKNMKKNELVLSNDNNIINKIIDFLKNVFCKNSNNVLREVNDNTEEENVRQEKFLSNIRVNDDIIKQTDMLSLKERYDRGEISIDDLTDEQVNYLIGLYDKSIASLKEKIKQYAV